MNPPISSLSLFSEKLLQWSAKNQRDLPWKKTKDAYTIWLSEIILQQTRVEQGKPYFLKFIRAYPTIQQLATAPEDEVMRLWEGLGYYSRARNLHTTAKYIAQHLNGIFPNNYSDIKKLKGVGSYTAAAIASFAYDLPYAVVDGNVYRVLGRYFGIQTPIDSTVGKKQFAELAQNILPHSQAAFYNQAIMDFGATQCTPKQANCTACVMKEDCYAFKNKMVNILPIKSKKLKRKERFFHYFIVYNPQKKIHIMKRTAKDIWQNLYQFPLLEADKILDITTLKSSTFWQQLFDSQAIKSTNISPIYKQVLTHQKIHARFIEIHLASNITTPLSISGSLLVERQELDNYAFPRIINHYIEDHNKDANKQLILL